jgi:hypothetical protein
MTTRSPTSRSRSRPRFPTGLRRRPLQSFPPQTATRSFHTRPKTTSRTSPASPSRTPTSPPLKSLRSITCRSPAGRSQAIWVLVGMLRRAATPTSPATSASAPRPRRTRSPSTVPNICPTSRPRRLRPTVSTPTAAAFTGPAVSSRVAGRGTGRATAPTCGAAAAISALAPPLRLPRSRSSARAISPERYGRGNQRDQWNDHQRHFHEPVLRLRPVHDRPHQHAVGNEPQLHGCFDHQLLEYGHRVFREHRHNDHRQQR